MNNTNESGQKEKKDDSKWPHLVALAGITVGALGTAFGVWMNANVNKTIANIESQSKIKELEIIKRLDFHGSRCQQLSEVAGKLAEDRADYFHNRNFEKRPAMEGFIWAGASYLSKEEQEPILKRFDQGQHPSDEFGIRFVAELSNITLRSLAESASTCRRDLIQAQREG